MSTTSSRMGLKVPDGSDPFLRTDFVQNYDTIDNYPGTWICTSATRPAWGAAQAGMCIIQTDTRSTLMWNGTTWHEMLYGPAVWWGSLRPGVDIGPSTNLSYVVGTITVNRPGTLFTFADVEMAWPLTGNVAMNIRAMVDGALANWDGSGAGEYISSIWRNTPAGFGGPFASDTIPAMGVRDVSAGTHSIGFSVATHTTWDSNAIAAITSCRQMAMFVNGDDR